MSAPGTSRLVLFFFAVINVSDGTTVRIKKITKKYKQDLFTAFTTKLKWQFLSLLHIHFDDADGMALQAVQCCRQFRIAGGDKCQ